MRSAQSHFYPKMLWSLVLILACPGVGCKSNGSKVAARSDTSASGTLEVHVVLEGPWAIAVDTDAGNSGGFVAIAPSISDHGLLYVQSYDGLSLLPGEYTLKIPNVPIPGTQTYTVLNEKVSKATFDAVKNDKAFRKYALHLPKPNGISEGAGAYARVDENGQLPVDSSITEVPYTTEISFDYNVPSGWKTLSVSGQTDPLPIGLPGVAVPLNINSGATVNGPRTFRVGTQPANDDLGTCSNQSKGAFHRLVGLFQLKKTIDFRNYENGCHDCDPQGLNPGPCRSTKVVQDLDVVAGLISKAKGSTSKERALNAIKAAKGIISSKQGGNATQRDLLEMVGSIKGYLADLKSKDEHFLEEYQAAAGKIDEIFEIMNLPARDCKSPLLSLTLQ
jgi:hypothetical protein